MTTNPYLRTPNTDVIRNFSTTDPSHANALEHARWSFDVVYGKCESGKTRIFKGCRLTNVFNPTYTILERLIRWIGDKLNLTRLYTFHEKETSYEFTVESVEHF